MEGEGDILADSIGAFTNFNDTLGGGLIGILMTMQIPLALIFGVFSAFLFWDLFGKKMVLIPPWGWKYKVIMLRPYADYKIDMWADKGTTTNQAGIRRFKIEKEADAMQLPDITDVYANNRIMIITLGSLKKFVAKQKINFKEASLLIDVENPQVAQQYFIDAVQQSDPDEFVKNINRIYLIWTMWFFSGVALVGANFLILYPIFVKALWMAGV